MFLTISHQGSANEGHSRVLLHILRMAVFRETDTVSDDMETLELSYIAGGM